MIQVKFNRFIRKSRAQEKEVPTEEWLARFGGKGIYITFNAGGKSLKVLSHIQFEDELDALAFKIKCGL